MITDKTPTDHKTALEYAKECEVTSSLNPYKQNLAACYRALRADHERLKELAMAVLDPSPELEVSERNAEALREAIKEG